MYMRGRPLNYGHALGIGPGISMIAKEAAKYDLFGTKAEQARKQRREQLAHERALAEEEFQRQQKAQKAKAVEDFRARISTKLREVEAAAILVADQMEEARRLASMPGLEGDPVLAEVDYHLADMEESLVRIQAGTVVDLGSSDPHALAVSYTDAQAALVAMTALKNRGLGVLEQLRQSVERLKERQIRLDARQREEDLARERQARAQAAALREQQFKAEEQQTQQRILMIQQVDAIEREIDEERRALQRARTELEAYRARLEEQQVREQAARLRQAQLEAMRARTA